MKKALKNYYLNWKVIWAGVLILFFCSCSNTHIGGKLKSKYPSREKESPVALYQYPDEIPVESESLGKINARSAKPFFYRFPIRFYRHTGNHENPGQGSRWECTSGEKYEYEDEFYESCTWEYGTKKKSYKTTLGLALSTRYQLLNGFGVDLTYRPGFLRFNSEKTWSYEHTISLGISWRIRLKPTYKFSIR